jgi:hypothetical protein
LSIPRKSPPTLLEQDNTASPAQTSFRFSCRFLYAINLPNPRLKQPCPRDLGLFPQKKQKKLISSINPK